ncbi:MAG: TIGR04283 family arsenosugar biosynthesis glycosyltransferase [Planctomycetota bacterium]|jgi:rSAM/selenodomain-associated transferase 2/rSAM/selenodomain-associated transferase 1
MNERLIIFTRYPEPGKTKTRLIPRLGPHGAARLQRDMTRHVLAQAKQLTGLRPVSVEVRFEGGDANLMRRCFGGEFPFRRQSQGDLGRRLSCAFEAAFEAGIRRVVIIGADCPAVTPRLLQAAFDRLDGNDLVLGPATDGGYYLIGLSRPSPGLFTRIAWGTGAVLEETLRAARQMNLATSRIVELSDVDRPEDLSVWHSVNSGLASGASQERISVIIPTLNEATCLLPTLLSLPAALNVELIVADGGSDDETVEIARQWGCRVVVAARNRARQMNAGAATATGSILLFLHADTLLPEGFDEHVRRTLARRPVVAGAFELHVDAPYHLLRVTQRIANLRARYWQVPYGDQAIFVAAEAFHSLGGFSELPIMEDFELMRRLRRRGRIVIAPATVVTSGRRWKTLGPWRTTWINQAILLAYCLGVSPERLARWYRRGAGGK